MITKIRFIVCSFVLTAFSGLSAQNDTTFVANGNPIIKYKYTADPGVWYMTERYISTPDTTNVLRLKNITSE